MKSISFKFLQHDQIVIYTNIRLHYIKTWNPLSIYILKAINLLSLQQDVNHITVLSFLSFSYLMISKLHIKNYVNLKWWLLNIEGAVFLSRKKKIMIIILENRKDILANMLKVIGSLNSVFFGFFFNHSSVFYILLSFVLYSIYFITSFYSIFYFLCLFLSIFFMTHYSVVSIHGSLFCKPVSRPSFMELMK